MGSQVLKWAVDHQAQIYLVLFGLSEALAVAPKVKSNSVFQLVFSFLKKKKEESELASVEPKL